MMEDLKVKYYLRINEIINKEVSNRDSEDEYVTDNELLHVKLDGVLTDLLEELGFNDIVALYDKYSEYFWYC